MDDDARPTRQQISDAVDPAGWCLILGAIYTEVSAVTLAEAVTAGLFVSKQAARKLPKRHGWKPVVEDEVGGHQYALTDIHAYLKSRGKR